MTMSNEHNCFVISPIGDPDSEVRKAADELLEYLIIPALRNCDFSPNNIIRADKMYSPGSINSDILALIKSCDLCIIDVTGVNPNVMYECGMRHGNGKPYIMMVKSGEKLPFDIAGIRTIQYDLSSLKKAKESQDILEQFVSGLIGTGFVRDEGTDSISSIAESIRQIEQKVDILVKNYSSRNTQLTVTPSNELGDILERLSPDQAFNYALSIRDVRLVDQLLPRLEQTIPKDYFISHAIDPACALGSQVAANYIKENWEFITATVDVHRQYECMASYVSYCNKMNIEEENIEFIKSCLAEIGKKDSTTKTKGAIYNQLNRLYYGAYVTSEGENTKCLDEALEAINTAIECCPDEGSYYFNKALIMVNIDIPQSVADIEKCLMLDKEDDDDHLALAYRLYRKTNNVNAPEILKRLQKVNPYLAQMTKVRYG